MYIGVKIPFLNQNNENKIKILILGWQIDYDLNFDMSKYEMDILDRMEQENGFKVRFRNIHSCHFFFWKNGFKTKNR